MPEGISMTVFSGFQLLCVAVLLVGTRGRRKRATYGANQPNFPLFLGFLLYCVAVDFADMSLQGSLRGEALQAA